MTVHHRRHKKQNLIKASILLEHNRVKSRISIEDRDLWEVIESLYEGMLLTEETLQEQQAVFNWISKLGKGAYNTIKSYTDKASGEVKKMAQDLADQVESQPVGGEIKKLLKKGDWSGAFKVATKWIKGQEGQPEGSENLQEVIQWLGDKWRNMKVGSKVTMVLLMLTIMFAKADITKADVKADNFGNGIEMVDDTGNVDKTGFQDNNEKPNQITPPTNVDFDTGTMFEFGSSTLDDAGLQQVDQIAQDYMNAIQNVLDNGGTIDSIDLDINGSASNTGDNWDVDNAKEGSLSQNRANAYGNALWEAMNKIAGQMGMDLGSMDINTSSTGMDANQLSGSEDIGQGEKDNNQNATSKMKVNFQSPTETQTSVDLGMQDYDMAKFGGETPEKDKEKEGFKPGTARGSRNLEYRDLLYLGGIDPIPVTFGDYKSDADMGRVDWRDVDTQGDKFLEDQQKMAIWITNTRKAKFPILKRIQNALQGVIDIEFDGSKKYKGVVGKKYEPSTTIPLTEAEGKLPPEINKEPQIPANIKSLQGNTTALWKYIIGKKAIGDLIDTQVASEFDKNMKDFLEQLDLMYGKSGTRGNVNFRYRKNPSYQGGKYADIPTTWNKKIVGEPEAPEAPVGTSQPGQNSEVLPLKQDYTGDYIQGMDGNSLVGSANPEDLKEEINRIKKLMK
jgi:hypothetical protein